MHARFTSHNIPEHVGHHAPWSSDHHSRTIPFWTRFDLFPTSPITNSHGHRHIRLRIKLYHMAHHGYIWKVEEHFGHMDLESFDFYIGRRIPISLSFLIICFTFSIYSFFCFMKRAPDFVYLSPHISLFFLYLVRAIFRYLSSWKTPSQ